MQVVRGSKWGWMLAGVGLLLVAGCVLRPGIRPPPRVQPVEVRMVATGYCHCGDCCGWKRNWWGRPVYAYGRSKGQPKQVGITASGTRVRHGTIAADTSIYPFGTVMYVPGYGYGVVEDRGGAIKGQRIDLYFKTHQRALEWGRQNVTVKVWKP
ncbi:MAG TPA: 3D domain-containing protein [Kiritimatiellia bacterium]|nr:3D domain-containing protein [Kiritimatiellia bacterium]